MWSIKHEEVLFLGLWMQHHYVDKESVIFNMETNCFCSHYISGLFIITSKNIKSNGSPVSVNDKFRILILKTKKSKQNINPFINTLLAFSKKTQGFIELSSNKTFNKIWCSKHSYK